jgi:hypothetical protein
MFQHKCWGTEDGDDASATHLYTRSAFCHSTKLSLFLVSPYPGTQGGSKPSQGARRAASN